MKKIVVINGSGGVGKDTFVNLCGLCCGVQCISSVDCIKEAAQLLGWDGITKDAEERKFLSDLKLLSTEFNDGPLKYITYKTNAFLYGASDDQILFIMIREPGEIAKYLKCYPEAKTLLIRSDRVPEVTSNIADANVADYGYDYIVNNNGDIMSLCNCVCNFLNWLRGGK